MTDTLDSLRHSVSRVILALIWVQVPIAIATAVISGNEWWAIGLLSLAVAVVATLSWWRNQASQATRLVIGVALIASLSLIVAAASHSQVQIDLHMAYFAELALLTAYCDRNVVIAGAGMTAVHHLLLNFLLPVFVFPDGSQFGRVLLHACILVIEASALVWLCQRIVTLFESTAANLAAAMSASEAARAAEAEAAEHRRLAEDLRLVAEIERTKAAAAQAAVVAAIGSGLEALAEGNVSHRLQHAFAAEYEPLRRNFNAAVGELDVLLRGVVGNTNAMQTGTDEIKRASDHLSRRTEQQAASLEEAAAALSEITSTVRRTSDSAEQARDVVSRTKLDVDRSGVIVQQAIAAMGNIEDSSRQVGQIIGVIDEIAFQTNLLALNAGVEAARAGDAGRGFAVVASEVRGLAQRSAEAAREIKALVAASATQVKSGVKLVGETGDVLGQIVTKILEVNTLVGSIAGSVQQQSAGLAEISTAVTQMDQVTQQNAAMVEETTAASHALAGQASDLARMTGRFQLGDSPIAFAA